MQVFCGYTADKKPFSLRTRRSQNWNQADELVGLEEARQRLQENDFLGLYLHPSFPLLVIDIDDIVPQNDYNRIMQACIHCFGEGCFYIERSISKKGLHIIIKTENLEEDWNRKKGIFFGYQAEIYTHQQGILLTEDYEDIPYALDFNTFWYFASPAPTHVLNDWFILSLPKPDSITKLFTTISQESSTIHQKPKNYTIFLELIHLFPSFYMPYLQPFIHHQANAYEIRLTRPNKDKSEGYSATFFTHTGIVYNFSTNWEGLPVGVGITLYSFIILTYKISAKTLAKRFYEFLKQSCKTLQLPIPKRKRKNYFRIKRKYLYILLIMEYLLQNPDSTIDSIQTHLANTLFFKIHRTTILRYLQTLHNLKLITKTKYQRKNHYAINLNQLPKYFPLREILNLERGYQLIMLQILLNLREASALAIIFSPPNVTLSNILHTSRGMPIYLWTPCRLDVLQKALVGRCFFSLYADPPPQ